MPGRYLIEDTRRTTIVKTTIVKTDFIFPPLAASGERGEAAGTFNDSHAPPMLMTTRFLEPFHAI